MDGKRRDVRMVQKLGCAEQKGEELVVVQTPDAMRACGLKIVRQLDLTHEFQVAIKNDENECAEVCSGHDAQLVEAEQPYDEVELVTRAVIDASPIAERLCEIRRHLIDGSGVFHTESSVPVRRGGFDEIQEVPESFVAESRTPLFVRGRLEEELLNIVKDAEQRMDSGA